MLKLYSNTNFLSETYRRQVFPLLFDLVFKPNQELLSLYHITDTITDADVVVFPIDYAVFIKHEQASQELLQLAKQHQKPLWVYTAGDYGCTNYIKNSYTFRLGGFDSQLSKTTFILPSFINDPYSTFINSEFKSLEKTEQPNIGFVGHAQLGFKKWLKEVVNHLKYSFKRRFKGWLVDKQSFYPSSIKRARYLQTLAVNDKVNTNFILRNQYRAGLHNEATRRDSSIAFYDNIYNTAYTFCIRGVGNFSVRFYETLAVGRIPILLNTDCRLPLADTIDWQKHCVIIDAKSKVPMVKQILDFHQSLSEAEFKALQQANRDLWLQYLKRDAYFKAIHKQFKARSL